MKTEDPIFYQIELNPACKRAGFRVKSGRTGRSRRRWTRKQRYIASAPYFLPLRPSPLRTNLCAVQHPVDLLFIHMPVKVTALEVPEKPPKPKYVRHYVQERE